MSAFGEATDLVVVYPIFKTFGSDQEEVERIILAKKKRTWAIGKLNGYGGKFEWDENLVPEKCRMRMEKEGFKTTKDVMLILNAIREIEEEGGIEVLPANLLKAGEILISFHDGKKVTLHIYKISVWRGDFVETEEMGPPEIFDIEKPLPYDEMIEGDDFWLLFVMRGHYFHAEMEKDANGSIIYFAFTKFL